MEEQISDRNPQTAGPEGSESPKSRRLASMLFHESNIQPEGKTKLEKIMIALDIFSFIPVPRTVPVSTKRSKIGSIIVILLFLVYVIYDFVELFLNNPPKVNTYEVPLDTTVKS